MQLTYQPYNLELKYPFAIAGFSRMATPLMLVQLHHEGFTGYGEASMVPYMGESHHSATAFLQRVETKLFTYPFDYAFITRYLDGLAPGQPAIKAAIDIALHDLEGKLNGQPCWQLLGSDPEKMPPTAYTIGMDTPDVLRQKLREAVGFKAIKVKLGSNNDRAIIDLVRSETDLPLYVDANQGWTDREQSLDLVHWLYEKGIKLIEQPFSKTDPDSNAWLTERSPIPIIGDEAVQRLPDVQKALGVYHGINVKLMKSAGMHEAKLMMDSARGFGMRVMIGCMSETSCATLAGAALAPQCDWVDLDGPFLTRNNPYAMPGFIDGKWNLSNEPGLGLQH